MSTTEQATEQSVAAAIEDIDKTVEAELKRLADAPWLSRLESDKRAQGRLLRLRDAERALDSAVSEAQQRRARLYRQDGAPVFAPLQHAEQERDIMARLMPAVEAATVAAEQAEQEAQEHLEATRHLDVMELLSEADLARANALRAFVKEAIDDDTVPATVIIGRVQGALRQGDKASLALYSRYGARRGLPVAPLAEAAAPEHAADRRRQEELRQAAVGLRLKARGAAAIVQHGTREAALHAEALASGRYGGKW